MARFYPLTVREIRRETRDAVVVTLEPPAGAAAAFRFVQGQYLTFRRDFGGEEVRRSYSICAGINDNALRIGVKRVEGGWFSTFANEDLCVGDTLEAMAPAGNFHTALEPGKAKAYLGFAGGSGITPLISIIKTVLETEPQSTFTLVYGNRGVNAIMFKEALEDIKNAHMGRLNLIHVLEQEADIELFSGMLTKDKCNALFDAWVNVEGIDAVFICGPEPMRIAVMEALDARGVPKEAVKVELFAASRPARSRQRPSRTPSAGKGAACKATVLLDGVSRDIEILKEGQTVLEAALAADIDAPYACKAGVCSTCRAKVVKGDVEMDANYALEDYEVERGYVLACQCRPLSDELIIDFNQ